MSEGVGTTEDGRRARRTRNRAAVVDALFDLLVEGIAPPSAEQIAAKAGVSISSVFRYFDGLDDLQRQTVDEYFTRFAPLLEVPQVGEGPLPERIDHFVDARLALYPAVAPIARLARSRAYDHVRIAKSLAEAREAFTAQIRQHFADELGQASDARADDLAELIDVLTAFESWDLQRSTHGRSDAQIRRAWVTALTSLLGAT
jgi:AcrR family transcriptional regulator